jgi:hypothetical protein
MTPDTAGALGSRIWQLAEEGDDPALRDLLADKPTRRVSITDAEGVARLLKELEYLARSRVHTEIGELSWSEGAFLLIYRHPWRHVSLADARGIALLLRWLNSTYHCWTSSPEDFVPWLAHSQDPVYLRLHQEQLQDPEGSAGYWASQHLAWGWARVMLGELATRAAEVAFTDAHAIGNLLTILSQGNFGCPRPVAQAAAARILERNPADNVPPVGVGPSSGNDPFRGLRSAEALITALRDAGDPDAASRLEQRAFAAGAYPYLRGDDGNADYGLMPDGTWAPAWAWTDVVPPKRTGG